MKKTLIIVAFLLACGWANAQSWLPLGPSDFNQASLSNAAYTSIAIDGSGTPYVAYSDEGNSGKATVSKYNGSSWEIVGSAAFSAGYVNYTSIAINSSGIPYVVYKDAGNGNKATVMKFNGSSWETVGIAGFSAGQVDYTSIAIDGSGVPYVVYEDWGNSNKATVMKYNGSSWEIVGSAAFSAGYVNYTSIAVNSSGIPYVVYQDVINSYKATVMKFSGTSWEIVGSVGFSAGTAAYTSIAINYSGIPYVVYQDAINSNKATVKKLSGSSWVTVGTVGFSAGTVFFNTIAFNNGGTPYVAYEDGGNSNKATVKKFNGTSWETVGIVGFSSADALTPSIALNTNGTPYVVYRDNNPISKKATVKKFNGSSWETVEGAGISIGDGPYTSITVNPNGTPYVVYQDVVNSSKATVKKFNGSTWETVGVTGFSTGNADLTSIAIDYNGIPFVVYGDGANNNKATVMKFTGNNWETVGSAGFSAGSVINGGFISLAINSSGTPYVAYRDDGNGFKATVKKYNGSNWETVGSVGFSAGAVYFTSIAINSSGTPYVAYTDIANGERTTVKKFNGSSWETVGSVGFSVGLSYYTSIALDASGTPYVVYDDYISRKATVKKYNGTSWETVGSMSSSIAEIKYTSIAINASGSPYIVYQDSGNEFKATVMKYNGSSWETVGSVGFSAGKADYTSIAINPDGTPYVAFSSGYAFAYSYRTECVNPTSGGTIAADQTGCNPFNPAVITSSAAPTGYSGTLEYKWQKSTVSSSAGFSDIATSNGATYDPPSGLMVTTWYKRLTRVDCKSDWTGAAESNVVRMTVNPVPGTPTAGNNGPVNVGETLNLTASPIIDATYGWTGPDSYSSATQNPTVSAGATAAMAGTYRVTATLNGCAGAAGTTDVTVNTPPEFTEGSGPVSVTCDEDNSPLAFALTLHATDIDANTITWSILTPATHGTASVSGTGSSKAISYIPAADYTGTDAFVVKIDDGLGTGNITVNVTVNAVNDAPVNTVPGAQTVAEDDDLIFSAANGNLISVSDADVAETTNGELVVHLTAENGILTLSQKNGLTFSLGNGTANTEMSFSGLPASLNAALSGLQFRGYPADFNGSALLTITTIDLGHTGSGGVKSDIDDITINVTAVNDLPVLSNLEGSALTYAENQDATEITGTITVTDPDDATMEVGTIQLTSNYKNGQDVLSFVNTAKITASWNVTTGELTLTRVSGQTPTLAEWQNALRSVKYQNTSDNPSTSPRTLTFIVNDGDDLSNGVTRLITVASENDAPALDLVDCTMTSITEDQDNNSGDLVSSIIASGGGDPITDADDGALEGIAIVASFDNSHGTWEYTSDGTTWLALGAVSGTSARLLYADANTRLRFNPTLSFNNAQSAAVTFHAWDRTGTGLTNGGTANIEVIGTGRTTPFSQVSVDINMEVSAENDAPLLGTVENKTVDKLSTLKFTVGATDPDLPANTLTFSLVGAPSGASINGSTGEFTWTPDAAQDPGDYFFKVRVTDDGSPGLWDEKKIAVTVYDNKPVASFDATPNPAACNQSVDFNASDSSHGRPDRSIVSYAWDFGDGTSGTGKTTTHTFDHFGSFTVALTVTDNNIPSKTASVSTLVAVNLGNQSPVANCGAPYSVELGYGTTLNGSSSSDPNEACGDEIVLYSWLINGSILLSGVNPSLSAIQVQSLGLGDYTVRLTVTDSFGATDVATGALHIIDTTPPAPPNAPDLRFTSDSGSSNTDNNTSDNTPTFDIGGVESNSTVAVYGNGFLLGTIVIPFGYSFGTFTPSTPMSDGTYVITAIQTDAAGNPSSSSAAMAPNLIIDTTKPVITLLGDNPMIVDLGGTYTEPGASVTEGLAAIINGVVNTGVIGDYQRTYDAADPAGNNAVQVTRSVQVRDITAPVQPNAPDLRFTSDSGSSNTDNITNDNTPTFDISGVESNSTVTLYGNGLVLGAVVTPEGQSTVSFTPTTPMSDGTYVIRAIQTDAAGNPSAASAAMAPDLIIDTGIHAITLLGDNPMIVDLGDTYTEPGATVTEGLAPNINGVVNTAVIGDYQRTYDAVDPAGNTSIQVTRTVQVRDISAPTPPNMPDLRSASDSGSSSTDNTTSDNTPTFDIGGVESGSTVTVYGNSLILGTVVIPAGQSTGTFTPATPMSDGIYNITAKQTDSGGNTSDPSQPMKPNLVIDTSSPLIICPAAQKFCKVVSGIYTIPILTATDNSSMVIKYSITGATTKFLTVGNDASGPYNVGVSTINWSVIDVSGNLSACNTMVTVNPLPVANAGTTRTISQNSSTQIGAAAVAGSTYAWSSSPAGFTSALANPTVSPQVTTTYYVTETISSTGCTNTNSVIITVSASTNSTYTILGFRNVNLSESNFVQTGSVGATASNGAVVIQKNSTVAGPGSFVKAKNISVSTGANVPVKLFEPVSTTLPTMLYNTSSTSRLSNLNVPDRTTRSYSGNYKDISIGHDCNVIFTTGTIFGKVNIGKSSKVTFNANSTGNLNMQSIDMTDGTDPTPTRLLFSSDMSVRLTDNVTIRKSSLVNPDGKKVVFYIGSSGKEFHVQPGGNVTVNASIYAPTGSITVEGNKSKKTYMDGMYIADRIVSQDKNIFWNYYPAFTLTEVIPIKSDSIPENPRVNTMDLQQFKNEVKVYPNPSNGLVTFEIQISENARAVLDLVSIAGMRIANIFIGDLEQGITQTVIFDQTLPTGVYFYSLRWKNQIITGKLILKRQ